MKLQTSVSVELVAYKQIDFGDATLTFAVFIYRSKMSAVPPSFGDLGKSARDLFDKEFSKDVYLYLPLLFLVFFNYPLPSLSLHVPQIRI